MNYIQIIALVFIIVTIVMDKYLNYKKSIIIDLQKKKLDELYEVLDKELVLTEFCVKNIMNISIKDEDYETAKRCQEILENIEITKTKTP